MTDLRFLKFKLSISFSVKALLLKNKIRTIYERALKKKERERVHIIFNERFKHYKLYYIWIVAEAQGIYVYPQNAQGLHGVEDESISNSSFRDKNPKYGGGYVCVRVIFVNWRAIPPRQISHLTRRSVNICNC